MALQDRTAFNLDPETHRLCVKVAKLYYEDELTQGKIARKLGYSRTKIHRILSTAKEHGVVQIQIHTPDHEYFELEHDLIKAYGLRDAVVVPTLPVGKELYLALGRGAVGWLKPRLKDGIRIGLGLGRTISHLPQVFEPNGSADCTFTEIVGAAADHNQEISSYNITSKMAELIGGKAEFFYAPTFVSSPSLKEELIGEPSVKKSLQRARTSDIILQSVGPVDETALLYLHGCLDGDALAELRRKGAVGDALGHYFDREGRPVRSFTDQLMIGLDLEDLTRVPWSVVIAGGPEKVSVIAAALRGEFFNVAVTDAETALQLIELER